MISSCTAPSPPLLSHLTIASTWKGSQLLSKVDESCDVVQTIMIIPFELAAVMR